MNESRHDDASAAEAIHALALVDLKEGRAASAVERLLSALELVSVAGDGGIVWKIHRAISEAYAAEGEYDRAIEHLQTSHQLFEEINKRETEERVRELEAEHEVGTARREAEIHRLRNVELARALSELKITQNRLIQAERVVSLGSLTAGVAHEINNPVNFIMTSVPPLRRDFMELARFLDAVLESRSDGAPRERWERLRREVEDSDIGYVIEEIELLLGGMTSGIARTREIIHGLSHFAAESGSERRRHDLRELIDQAVDSLRGDAPEGIRFEVEGERPIEIECDEREIRRLLLNILDNAVRSIDGRGMVRLSTESGPGIVSIAIADTGCGISEKIGRRIFEPFFTTREVGSGTGLGLAIAYAIARRHRGEITVTSIEGRGSTFTVTLPRG